MPILRLHFASTEQKKKQKNRIPYACVASEQAVVTCLLQRHCVWLLRREVWTVRLHRVMHRAFESDTLLCIDSDERQLLRCWTASSWLVKRDHVTLETSVHHSTTTRRIVVVSVFCWRAADVDQQQWHHCKRYITLLTNWPFKARTSHERMSAAKDRHYTAELHNYSVLFCSSAILDPRVGHTMDVLSPFISVLCHSDWLFYG